MATPFSAAARLAILFAGLFVYGSVLGFYFTDVDTFSLIATSRFRDLEGLLGVLTSPMMKGELPNALFFRPFSSITWAVDEWFWGLNPVGYHLTDLAIHLLNAMLLFTVVRNIGGQSGGASPGDVVEPAGPSTIRERDVAAFVAGLIFCVHPIGVETVAAIARRPDLLFGTFSLVALIATQRRMRTGRARDGGWVALACVLALASKDSAVITLGLVALYVLWFAEVASWTARLTMAVRVCVGPLLAMVIYVGYRAWVLGGMGGYHGSRELGLLAVAKTSAHVFSCSTVMPGQLDDCEPRLSYGLMVVLALLASALVSSWWQRSNRLALLRVSFAASCVLTFYVLYLVTSTAAMTRTIYAMLPYISMAFAGLLVGAIAGFAQSWRALRERWLHATAEALAGVAVSVVVGALFVGAVRGQYLEEWGVIGERVRGLIASFESSIHDVVPGSLVYTVNIPFKVKPGPERLRDHPLLDDYSVQGWVDLAYPKHKLDIVGLSRVWIAAERPSDLTSRIAFDPQMRELEISVGPRGRIEVFEAWEKRAETHPLAAVRASVGIAGQRVSLRLIPEALARTPIAFWVYSGGEVHLEKHEPWVLEHSAPIGAPTIDAL